MLCKSVFQLLHCALQVLHLGPSLPTTQQTMTTEFKGILVYKQFGIRWANINICSTWQSYIHASKTWKIVCSQQKKNQGINESLTMHIYYWYVLLKETLDILKTLPVLLLLVHKGLGDLPGIVKLSFWVSSDFYACLLCSRATSATIRKARLFLLHLLSHMNLVEPLK